MILPIDMKLQYHLTLSEKMQCHLRVNDASRKRNTEASENGVLNAYYQLHKLAQKIASPIGALSQIVVHWTTSSGDGNTVTLLELTVLIQSSYNQYCKSDRGIHVLSPPFLLLFTYTLFHHFNVPSLMEVNCCMEVGSLAC